MNKQLRKFLKLSICAFTLILFGLSSLILNANVKKNIINLEQEKVILKKNKNKKIKKTLTFADIIDRIIKNNPELLTYQMEIKSKDGMIEQSSLLPNPELEMEVENFAGSGETKGFRQSETTIKVSQSILLGGKREKKIKVARFGKNVSISELDKKLVDLETEAKMRFVTILHVQKKLELRKKMIKLSKNFSEKIKIRVESGRTSPAELMRANVSLLRNEMIYKQLQKELSASNLYLTALWGGKTVDFQKILGDMELYSFIPKIKDYKKLLNQNVNLLSILEEIELQKARWHLEKSYKVPDIALMGGVRKLNESGNTAFTFNISVPLPLFNRNQGKIKSSLYRLKKSESKLRTLKVKLLNKLKILFEQLEITYNNAIMLKISILPKASKMLDVITQGYELGKFNYLNVLDALKTQLDMREEYLEALSNYWQIIAKIEKLTCLHFKKSNFINMKHIGDKNE